MGLSGPVPPRVDQATKTGLLVLLEQARQLGWTMRSTCQVLEVSELRIYRWLGRRAAGELADQAPGGSPMHRLLDWKVAEIVRLFAEWGEVDRSHRKLAHRGSYLERCGSRRPACAACWSARACSCGHCHGPAGRSASRSLSTVMAATALAPDDERPLMKASGHRPVSCLVSVGAGIGAAEPGDWDASGQPPSAPERRWQSYEERRRVPDAERPGAWPGATAKQARSHTPALPHPDSRCRLLLCPPGVVRTVGADAGPTKVAAGRWRHAETSWPRSMCGPARTSSFMWDVAGKPGHCGERV